MFIILSFYEHGHYVNQINSSLDINGMRINYCMISTVPKAKRFLQSIQTCRNFYFQNPFFLKAGMKAWKSHEVAIKPNDLGIDFTRDESVIVFQLRPDCYYKPLCSNDLSRKPIFTVSRA